MGIHFANALTSGIICIRIVGTLLINLDYHCSSYSRLFLCDHSSEKFVTCPTGATHYEVNVCVFTHFSYDLDSQTWSVISPSSDSHVSIAALCFFNS